MRGIKEGTRKFFIIHAGRCIGEFSTTFSKNENTIVKSVGDANAVYGKLRTSARVGMIAQFNPLGQMLESNVEISAEDSRISARAREINPLRIHIQATSGQRNFEYDFTAPGPVLIKGVGGGVYEIQYSGMRAGNRNYFQTIGAGLLGGLDLKLQDAEESGITCSASERGFLDIAALSLKSQQATGALQQLMPDALP